MVRLNYDVAPALVGVENVFIAVMIEIIGNKICFMGFIYILSFNRLLPDRLWWQRVKKRQYNCLIQ